MSAMGFIMAALLLAVGMLASGQCRKKLPIADEEIDRLMQRRGWIGLVLAAFSIVALIHCLGLAGGVSGAGAWIYWVFYLLTTIAGIALGAALGMEIILRVKRAIEGAPTASTPNQAAATEDIQGGEETTPASAAPTSEAAAPQTGEAAAPPGEFKMLPLSWLAYGCMILAIVQLALWLEIAPASPMFTTIVTSLGLLLAGSLAAMGMMARKTSPTAEIVEEVCGVQQTVGTLLWVWGILAIIYVFRVLPNIIDAADAMDNAGRMARVSPAGIWVWWIFALLASLLALGLGFMSSCERIMGWFKKEPDPDLRAKFLTIQIPVGLAAVAIGLWHMLSGVIWIMPLVDASRRAAAVAAAIAASGAGS